jgi:hypothetical protein
LGNSSSTFYVQGRDLGDYGIITDFNLAEGDIIRLSGSAGDYTLVDDGVSTEISYTPLGVTISVVENTVLSGFSAGFEFV